MIRSLKVVGFLSAAVALLASGCGESTDPVAIDAPLWDPCAAFPDTALEAVGVDPARNTGGDLPDRRCSWVTTNNYILAVEYITKNWGADWKLTAADPTEVTIGPYSGHTYYLKGEGRYLCDIQLKTRSADVVFEVKNSSYKDEDPCAVATRIVTGLVDYLPPVQ